MTEKNKALARNATFWAVLAGWGIACFAYLDWLASVVIRFFPPGSGIERTKLASGAVVLALLTVALLIGWLINHMLWPPSDSKL